MSRTDNDTPPWLYQPLEPYHVCRQFHSRFWQRFRDNCDLPTEPPQTWDRNWANSLHASQHCRWMVAYLDYPERKYRYWARRYGPRMRPYTHTTFYGPDRAQARDRARQAIADFRANGDTDIEPEKRQHRHSVQWWW